jgi:hypothetical protein
MSEIIHALADLVTNTFCALLGIRTVRLSFYNQFAATTDKTKNHQCENTLLLLMEFVKVESKGVIKHSLATISQPDSSSVSRSSNGHVLSLTKTMLSFQLSGRSICRRRPSARRYKKIKLSPVGPVMKEGIE